MELEVNVEGVEKTLNEIERDLHRGMERSMDNLVDNAKGRARRVIAETDSIFNAEVYKGFKDAETKNNGSRIRAKVYNDVGHADALEHGATYGSKGPPVAALLPWVARKMHWSPDFDFDSGGSDDSGGGSSMKGNYDDGKYFSAEGSTTDEELTRSDIVSIAWDDGTTDDDVQVLDIVDNNVIKIELDGGSRFVNLDGRESYKRADRVVKTGEADTISVSEGDVVVSDLNIKGTVKEVGDDEITIEFNDDVGTYTDRVDANTVRNEYNHFKGDTVVDGETLEEDLTDEGLTLSKQADDLAINSGDLDGVFERASRETLFKIEEIQRDRDMPKVDSISRAPHETVEDVFDDDSSTIILPDNLLEFDTEFTGANFDGLYRDNGEFYNSAYDIHLSYVIDHQYGRYIYDNLSDNGLNEFRERWGFIEGDDGWELPGDAEDISGLAATGERAFFGEVYVENINNPYNYRESGKRDFFERINSLDEDYLTQEFRDKPRDTPGYNIGYDYSGDREVVLEEHIDQYSTRKTQSFTTDFNNYHYVEEGPNGDAFKERAEYIFTGESFEGARVYTHINGEFVWNDMEKDRDELTLQGIGETEKIFNNIERGDELILESSDFEDPGDYASVKITTNQNNVWQQEISEGENVFTGQPEQVDKVSIVATREQRPDLWADGYETVQPVELDDVDDGLTSNLSEDDVTYDTISNTIEEVGHFVLKDSSGNNYRAVRNDDRASDYISLHPNENGEKLTWDEEDIEVTHLNEHSVKYNSIERDDNILVDPDELAGSPSFTDTVYRATVKEITSTGVRVVPFGSSSNSWDTVGYEAFIDTREDLPGWDSKNWDVGTKVTVDKYSGEYTGRLEIPKPSSDKSYEESSLRLTTEDDKDSVRFTLRDVVSYEEDDFMEQYEQPPDNIDFSLTEFSKYDGEITTDDLSARNFDPLEGVDELEEGDEVIFRAGGGSQSGTISTVFTQDGERKYIAGEGTGGYEITPDDITSFEGMGVERDEIDVGDTVSTGSQFGDILDIDDSTATVGVDIDYNGDGVRDDVLDLAELQTVDFVIPEGSKVFFFSNREGERKTGIVKSNSFGHVNVETEDGELYRELSSAYPIDILGVDM